MRTDLFAILNLEITFPFLCSQNLLNKDVNLTFIWEPRLTEPIFFFAIIFQYVEE